MMWYFLEQSLHDAEHFVLVQHLVHGLVYSLGDRQDLYLQHVRVNKKIGRSLASDRSTYIAPVYEVHTGINVAITYDVVPGEICAMLQMKTQLM